MQIGNGFISSETDMKGMYEFWGSHALVSDEITDQIMKYCYSSSSDSIQQHDACNEAIKEAIPLANAVNNYNIYAPTCFNHSLTQNPNKPSVSLVITFDDYIYIWRYNGVQERNQMQTLYIVQTSNYDLDR